MMNGNETDTAALLHDAELSTPAGPLHSINDSDVQVDNCVSTPSSKLPQYVAALSGMLSAFCAGIVLGWTSPILSYIEHGHFNNITVDENQMGWIGSFVTVGGLSAAIPTGFLCDLCGRKRMLLLLIIPFCIGWTLILFSTNLLMLYLGRLFTGLASGACCVAAPLYTNEISERSIRGTLGAYFQLMVTVGVFVAYTIGKFADPYTYTIICSLSVPLYFILFSVQPESPIYYLGKGKRDDAVQAMRKLRGRDDNTVELALLEAELRSSTANSVTLSIILRRKANVRALMIAFALMFFQQFSGINAVILYTSEIFDATGIKLDAHTATILVGAFQMVATFVASLLVDKAGRKILLLISSFAMSVSVLFLAIFFTLKTNGSVPNQVISSLTFIPIVSLCVFVVAFSIGIGPLPWLISYEIFTPEIKSIAGAAAGTLNWFLAFLITKFYLQTCQSIGQDVTFYVFSGMSLVGAFFVKVYVPETKNKSIEEIQQELER